MKTNTTPSTMNANEVPANVTFTEYTGETNRRNIVDTINVNGVECGIRVRRMHGLNPANYGEYYVIYAPDEKQAERIEAELKAAGHNATPDEYGVIVRTWAAFMAGVEMLNPKQSAPEFSELSHAGQCLDIYLHNTAEIYNRFTMPAIEACVKAQSVKTPEMWDYIKQALKAAACLVIKHDGITPTADDIKAVSANYAAYITECAEYQATTA